MCFVELGKPFDGTLKPVMIRVFKLKGNFSGIDENSDKSVRYYNQISNLFFLRREDGYVFRRALDIDVQVQGKRGRLMKHMEEAGGGRKFESWFEQGRFTLPIKVDCWC